MARPLIERLKEALIAAKAAGNPEDVEYIENRIKELQAQEKTAQTPQQMQTAELSPLEEHRRRTTEIYNLLEERDGVKLYQHKVTGEKQLVSDRATQSDPAKIKQWEEGKYRMPAGPQAGAMSAAEFAREETPGFGAAAQFLSGIPYVGEYTDEMLGRTPFETQMIREARKSFEAEQPIAAGATKLAGTVTGLVGEAAVLGPMLAPKGVTTAQKAVSGATRVGFMSALEGAMSGYGRGETAEQRTMGSITGGLTGALVGGAVGGLMPVADVRFKKIIQTFKGKQDKQIAKKLGIDPAAAKALREALQNDDFDAALAGILRAGDQTMLADASPAFKNILDVAVESGGKAARTGTEAVKKRAEAANKKFQGYLDKVLGQPVGRAELKKTIMSESEAVRRKLYDAAYAKPIDYSTKSGAEIQEIVKAVPNSVLNRAKTLMKLRREKQVQSQLALIEGDYNVQFLDYVKRALQDGAKSAARSGNTVLSDSYSQLARQLREAIAENNPAYRDALTKAGDVIQDREAVDIGYDLLSKRITREEAEDLLLGASQTELKSARRGLRIGVDDKLADISRSASDPNTDVKELHAAMKAMTSRSSMDKLELLLGKKGAEELSAELTEALTAAELSAALARNSKTSVRQTVKASIEGATAPGIAGELLLGIFGAKRGGVPLVEGVQTMVKAMIGQSDEAIRIRQQGLYDDLADVLTRAGSSEALKNLKILTEAIESGRKLKETEAKIIAGYFVKRATVTAADRQINEAEQ